MSSTQLADAQNEIEALHCEAVSRLSSALGVHGPDVVHARRLGRLLNVERLSDAARTSTARPPRTPLFGGAIVAPSAKASVTSPTYVSLEEALPDWYEAHNRRCAACHVALFIGLNATFTCHEGERGIVCGRCSTVNVSEKPSYESKRTLRSQKYRASKAKKAAAEAAQTVPKKRPAELIELTHAVPPKVANTLAERQAELKRKQKDAKKANAKPVSSTDSTQDAESSSPRRPDPLPIEIVSPEPQAPPTERLAASSRLSMNNKRNMAEHKAAPKPDRDALALQEMLQRNRKRQQERSKRAEPKTGLQDFLSSL